MAITLTGLIDQLVAESMPPTGAEASAPEVLTEADVVRLREEVEAAESGKPQALMYTHVASMHGPSKVAQRPTGFDLWAAPAPPRGFGPGALSATGDRHRTALDRKSHGAGEIRSALLRPYP